MVRPVSPELRENMRQVSPARSSTRSASPESRGSQHCGAKMALQIYSMRPPRNPDDGQFDAAIGPSPASVSRKFNITSKVRPPPFLAHFPPSASLLLKAGSARAGRNRWTWR